MNVYNLSMMIKYNLIYYDSIEILSKKKVGSKIGRVTHLGGRLS